MGQLWQRWTHQQEGDGHDQSTDRHSTQSQEVESSPSCLLHQEELEVHRTHDGHVMCCTQTHAREQERNTHVTYRDNGEDGVDKSGSDGGVDRLLHASWLKDACRVVEHLNDTEGTAKKKHFCSLINLVRVISLTALQNYIKEPHYSEMCFSYVYCTSPKMSDMDYSDLKTQLNFTITQNGHFTNITFLYIFYQSFHVVCLWLTALMPDSCWESCSMTAIRSGCWYDGERKSSGMSPSSPWPS